MYNRRACITGATQHACHTKHAHILTYANQISKKQIAITYRQAKIRAEIRPCIDLSSECDYTLTCAHQYLCSRYIHANVLWTELYAADVAPTSSSESQTITSRGRGEILETSTFMGTKPEGTSCGSLLWESMGQATRFRGPCTLLLACSRLWVLLAAATVALMPFFQLSWPL